MTMPCSKNTSCFTTLGFSMQSAPSPCHQDCRNVEPQNVKISKSHSKGFQRLLLLLIQGVTTFHTSPQSVSTIRLSSSPTQPPRGYTLCTFLRIRWLLVLCTRSDSLDRIFCALSSCFLDVKPNSLDLFSPANITTAVLPPELEKFLPPLESFYEVSKASTFASSMSSIPLDITCILGTLSLLRFVDCETSKGFSTFALLVGSLHTTVLSILSFIYLSL
jgi:hypothetical protein